MATVTNIVDSTAYHKRRRADVAKKGTKARTSMRDSLRNPKGFAGFHKDLHFHKKMSIKFGRGCAPNPLEFFQSKKSERVTHIDFVLSGWGGVTHIQKKIAPNAQVHKTEILKIIQKPLAM